MLSPIRKGKFRKKMATLPQLLEEAPILEERFRPFFLRYERNEISPAELCAHWVFEYVKVRYPDRWWGSKREKISEPLSSFLCSLGELIPNPLKAEHRLLERYATLGDIFNERSLLSTPLAVNRSLLKWEEGEYPIVLFERIPSVEEVLGLQVEGKRCVTVFRSQESLSRFILDERDPMSFCFHDLIHADHFFHSNEMKHGQIGFYRLIKSLMDNGLLDLLTKDERLAYWLEYYVSDMNSHCVHLLMGLKYLLVKTGEPKLFDQVMSFLREKENWSDREVSAFSAVNTDDFSDSDALALESICYKRGKLS
jgi:hypothetical protein